MRRRGEGDVLLAASAVVNTRSSASRTTKTRFEKQQLLADMGHLEDQYEAVRTSAEELQEGLRATSAELQAAQRAEAAAKESAKKSEQRARLIVEGSAVFVGLTVCLGISGWSYPLGRKCGDEKGARKDDEWAEPAKLPKQAAYRSRLALKLGDLCADESVGKDNGQFLERARPLISEAAHNSSFPTKLDGFRSDSIAKSQGASQVTDDHVQAAPKPHVGAKIDGCGGETMADIPKASCLTGPAPCVGNAVDVEPATQVVTRPTPLAAPRVPTTSSALVPTLQTPTTPTSVSPPPAAPKSPPSMAQTADAGPVRCQYFHMDVDVGTHKERSNEASPLPDQRCGDAGSSGSKAGARPSAGASASSRGNSLSREDEDAWWGRP